MNNIEQNSYKRAFAAYYDAITQANGNLSLAEKIAYNNGYNCAYQCTVAWYDAFKAYKEYRAKPDLNLSNFLT